MRGAKIVAVLVTTGLLPGCATIEPWGQVAPAGTFPLRAEASIASQTPTGPPADAASCARAALRDAMLGLGDLALPRRKQIRLPEHPPLQLFPRLVSPAFAERCGGAWYVPWILEDDGVATGRRERFAERPTRVRFDGRLTSFWLEPAAEGQGIAIAPTDVWSESDIEFVFERSQLVVHPDRDLRAYVLRIGSEDLPGGYYWLRAVPRFAPRTDANPFEAALRTGDLAALRGYLDEGADEWTTLVDDVSRVFQCARRPLRKALRLSYDTCNHPMKHFWPRLSDVVAAAASGDEQDVVAALEALYFRDLSPAGVLLDDGVDEAPFMFAVTGDVQDSKSARRLRRVFEMIENKEDPFRRPLENAGIDAISFVLLAGDLADGEAGSAIMSMVTNMLGLAPPLSVYSEEYPRLAGAIRGFERPFVAVPGNHDGFVGYGGVVNLAIAPFPLGVRRMLDRVVGDMPILFRPPSPAPFRNEPRYDGLVEWEYALGATSYAFRFRGHGFFGLNSYGLRPEERSTTGGASLNWGGGVGHRDLDWLDRSLTQLGRRSASEPKGHQFLFMHHDPRGYTPKERGSGQFGLYDEIDVLGSLWTGGYLGLLQSPWWDTWLPGVTPLMHHGTRLVNGSVLIRLQEEWMRRSITPWGFEPVGEWYGAEGLVSLIDHHMRAGDCRACGIDALFFGHNNVTDPELHWANDEGQIAWETAGRRWTPDEFRWTKKPFLHLLPFRSSAPPKWLREFRAVGDGRDVRLDDVADSEEGGVHLVTVHPDRAPEIQHVKLPAWEPGPLHTRFSIGPVRADIVFDWPPALRLKIGADPSLGEIGFGALPDESEEQGPRP